ARHHTSPFTRDGFAYPSGYVLTPGQPPPGMGYPPASPPSLAYYRIRPGVHPDTDAQRTPAGLGPLVSPASTWSHHSGYGNINPLSIGYACRPRLRSRLSLGG